MATGEWWVSNEGANLLKGVEDDEDNPILLEDNAIVDFLRQIPAARDSFNRLYPTMLPDEKVRLVALARSATHTVESPLQASDSFQNKLNRQGIHLERPRP